MQAFADSARTYGLLINDLLDDGRVHGWGRNGAYRLDGEWVWVQALNVHMGPVIWRKGGVDAAVVLSKGDMDVVRREEAARREQAAVLAAAFVQRCENAVHPYLARNRFPDQIGLIDTDGRLVVPVRDVRGYRRVNSMHWIDDSGAMVFLSGETAKGSIIMVGAGAENWLCEGYATGLSLRLALAQLHRQARRSVFFRWKLRACGQPTAGLHFVIADNDKFGTGERLATTTSLPWAMPPHVSINANDYHLEHGVHALTDLMRGVLAYA